MHVGLIPDGSRRWSVQNGLSLSDAYKRTMRGIKFFLEFMFGNDISAVSVYLLSKENLHRSPSDLTPVIEEEINFVSRQLPELISNYDIRVFHAGRKMFLPAEFANALSEICLLSRTNKKHRLYLLAAYNPFDELAKMKTKVDNVSQLSVPEFLDVIVRTSGEQRLSNFLPLQSSYAELIFIRKHFNDLKISDYKYILREFKKRKRRFGE